MATLLSPTARIVASRDQLSTALAGEAVILGMRDSVYYGLDAVGARIWALVQEPRTLDEVTDTIVAEYEVERSQAFDDVLALSRDLLERGLLEIVPPPAP